MKLNLIQSYKFNLWNHAFKLQVSKLQVKFAVNYKRKYLFPDDLTPLSSEVGHKIKKPLARFSEAGSLESKDTAAEKSDQNLVKTSGSSNGRGSLEEPEEENPATEPTGNATGAIKCRALRCSARVGSSLTLKYNTSLKYFTRHKHWRLLSIFYYRLSCINKLECFCRLQVLSVKSNLC